MGRTGRAHSSEDEDEMGEDAEEMGEDVVGEEEQLGKTGEDKWASTLVRVTGPLSSSVNRFV